MMSTTSSSSLILCFFFFFISTALSLLPTPLLIPITKDPSTHHYTTTINYLQNPSSPTNLLLDLDSSINWLNCKNPSSSSSSINSIPCNSSLCNSITTSVCSNTTCALFPENPLTHKSKIADAFHGSVSLPITNGRNPGQLTLITDFIFSCSSHPELLNSLPDSVTGVVSLSRSNSSLPAQVSNSLTLPFLFALCLSGSTSAPGVAFFGTRGPYVFLPETDIANSLIYTPLLLNPVSNAVVAINGLPSNEYYVGLTSVKVNGNAVKINESLLSIDEDGFGGTKFSAVAPYTTMETSIYKEFIKAFVREAAASMNLNVSSSSVEPFDVCFSSDDVERTRVGPAVPTVDLMMGSDDVFWRLFGENSMVKINEEGLDGGGDLWCLGFVDGGSGTNRTSRASIVIGGHQMEDHLIQFDLGLKRVGFSPTLLIEKSSCANFNFTTDTL